jgi:DNA-binding response OmpR family regulator
MIKVLLLDDNRDMLAALGEALELNNHAVSYARNARHGLEVLEKSASPPDIIVSDLHMPDLDGLELLRQVRQNPEWAQIPTIIMSGRPTDQQMVLNAGADAFLIKPFAYHELEALIRQLLQS